MHDIFIKPLPQDCRFTVSQTLILRKNKLLTSIQSLVDSCHSGTILDLPFSRYYGPLSVNTSLESLNIPRSPTNQSPTSPTSPQHYTQKELQTKVYHDLDTALMLPNATRPGSPISPTELAFANHFPVRGPLGEFCVSCNTPLFIGIADIILF